MKAIRLVEIGQPLEMQEIPTPEPGPGEVRVRVRAAGVCHSDAHYRAGTSPVGALPQTLGHEVAGVVEAVGEGVSRYAPGDRVALHYLLSCGTCAYCAQGSEQFCVEGSMIGKYTDGGFAEAIVVPARSVIPLPDAIPFTHGAVLMCSAATSLHALRRGRLAAGETAAVFGVGGLGMAAVQLARAMGARDVYAVDLNADKLARAAELGAVPVDASAGDPSETIRGLTGGRGVDVALDMVGLPDVQAQVVRALAVFGRGVLVGLGDAPFEVDGYREVIGREAAILGASDHLLSELPLLLDYAERGALTLTVQPIPFTAAAVNAALDALERFEAPVRSVVVMA